MNRQEWSPEVHESDIKSALSAPTPISSGYRGHRKCSPSSVMHFYQFVARSHFPAFEREEVALSAWRGLKKIFPQVGAAVLMPNHLHVFAQVKNPEAVRVRICHLLGALTREYRLPEGFSRVTPVEPVESAEKIRRNLRYVILNPCRADLCRDPLEWRWSTYRQLVGAAYGQWTSQEVVAACGYPGRIGLKRLHAYVSSDPSVQVRGSRLPEAARGPLGSDEKSASLEELFAAARAAYPEERRDDSPRIRASFIWLARNQGWTELDPLARYLKTSRSSVWYWASRAPRDQEDALLPERYCLADARLRWG